jgi:hypothetical protein
VAAINRNTSREMREGNLHMGFVKQGAGVLLADIFDRILKERSNHFPHGEIRGKTLLIAADLGGSHAGQLFETYSFIVLDIDRNSGWLTAQADFRRHQIRSLRRMSFKAMNDKVRKSALVPFLQIGNRIHGWLITFAISKRGGSLFQGEPTETESGQILMGWKRPVRERLLRVLHLSAFLLSGLSSPDQNVLWVIDEDDIAANVEQLTQLTKLLAIVSSNSLIHSLSHLRCATTQSDDGTRSLEDLTAYCDLAAGSICEIATAMKSNHRFLQRDIISPLPSVLSWKTRVIASWLANSSSPLRRLTCLIDLKEGSAGMRAQILRWHALPGHIITNSNF